jgi:drug/metabolite transporter (DMT)-like permease
VLRQHWRPIFLVGLTNSALPFLCFSYAALSITAGLSAIFNAASPLFGAVIAWLWLNDRLNRVRVLGLVIGFAGVLWLAWNKADHSAAFKPGGSGWAIVACLAGAVLYGISASLTKKTLAGVAPMAVAAGSQLAAALALALPAVLWWPAAMPSGAAWLTAALLAIFSTGVAYVLYFRLIANIGPQNAIGVTYLLPAFAVLWGWLLLNEQPTLAMVVGCAVILLGTSLATGLLKPDDIRRQFIGRPT